MIFHKLYNDPSLIIPLTDNIIDLLIQPSIHSPRLKQLQATFTGATALTFYTDGSLTGPRTNNCKMGFGWISLHPDNGPFTFKASLANWPSSTRAEIYALLTALVVSPNNAVVDVYLDSQATIHGFHKYVLSNHLSLRKLEKVPNHMIWNII